MDMQRLVKFLRRARERCSYEVGGLETVLQDGTRIIGPYAEGQLSYVDKYGGFEQFSGREVITLMDNLIWKREYCGGIIDERYKIYTLEIFDVLKIAMRLFPRDKPFKRGFHNIEVEKVNGKYQYFDLCEGDMTSFKGKEQIFNKLREVYFLGYSGGLEIPYKLSIS